MRVGARCVPVHRYEIALGLSLIGVLIYAGSFSLRDIVDSQAGTWLGFIPKWNLFRGQFVAFFIYIMAAYAEGLAILNDADIGERDTVKDAETAHVIQSRFVLSF